MRTKSKPRIQRHRLTTWLGRGKQSKRGQFCTTQEREQGKKGEARMRWESLIYQAWARAPRPQKTKKDWAKCYPDLSALGSVPGRADINNLSNWFTLIGIGCLACSCGGQADGAGRRLAQVDDVVDHRSLDADADDGFAANDVDAPLAADIKESAAPADAGESSGDAGKPPKPLIDDGPPYSLKKGLCAQLAPYNPNKPGSKCENVVCPQGQMCMGAGYCLLIGAIAVTDPEPAMLTGAAEFAVGPNDRWAMLYSGYPDPYTVDKQNAETKTRVYLRFRQFFNSQGKDGQGTGSPPVILRERGDNRLLMHTRLSSLPRHGWLAGWVRAPDLFAGYFEIRAIAFNGDLGPVQQLSEKLAILGGSNENGPRFAPLANGNRMVAVWNRGGYMIPHMYCAKIRMRLLDSKGQINSPAIDVTSYPDCGWAPSVTSTGDGALIVWASMWANSKNNPARLRARRLDASGAFASNMFALPDIGWGFEAQPGTAGFADGAAMITRAAKKHRAQTPVDYFSYLLPPGTQPPVDLVSMHLAKTTKFVYEVNAPTVRHYSNRAVIVWADWGDTNTISLRRYYRKDDVYDCESTPVVPAPKNITLPRSCESLVTFSDGRVLVGWCQLDYDHLLGSADSQSGSFYRFLPQ